jgi:hypothetical protein
VARHPIALPGAARRVRAPVTASLGAPFRGED